MDKIGKKRRLHKLSNPAGCFSMLAIDQRQSLRKMISSKTGESPQNIKEEELKHVKRVVSKNLSPKASAILTDPIIGYSSTWDVIAGETGVMLSIEQTGYATVNQNERLTRLLLDWDVEKALHAGADGIKLLLWYNKNASEATLEHQTNVVMNIGAACERFAMPFVLEVVCYPLSDIKTTSPDYAHQKALGVIDAARTFSSPEFRVDLLKLEFPGNLKYVKEYKNASFHGGEVIHDISEVKDLCRQVDHASEVPWVILSAGVEPEEFIENIKLCNDAGASGFLCGRAVWKDIIQYYPDEQTMQKFISKTASQHFDMFLEANQKAHPWFQRNMNR